ncbi:MAG: hypothetical protein SV422_08675 [Pseudomonadota bacterium]|nr:hypothetical protein [Pseudomonadota bacterium]
MTRAINGELMPEVLRSLDLPADVHPHGTRWLSAASGLVCVGQYAYVIADDEHHLGYFTLDTVTPLTLVELFAGALPRNKGKRKKAKPDLECLMLAPPLELYPHGALLALGSGSRPARKRAALMALDSTGGIDGPPLLLDLAALYAPLQERLGDLNIEGAFHDGTALHLLQRGNKGSRNARISFAWSEFSAWLLAASTMPPVPHAVQWLDLGAMGGVPLTPTDALALENGHWLFCAVAENTDDSYADGACLGSALGIVDAQGRIESLRPLHGKPKVEGIALEPGSDPAGAELGVLMVTDADDPLQPSRLLRCTLAR